MPSHQKKIEQVLDLLINEEHDAASELLHSVIVEKARGLYEDLVDEDFGGDMKADFADDIQADKNEIEGEELYDDEDDLGDEDMDDEEELESPEEQEEEDEEHEELDDRVDDLEAQLADLRAEFDELLGAEEDELGDVEGAEEEEGEDLEDLDRDDEMDLDDMEDEDMDMEESMFEEDFDDLDEATKLTDEVGVSLDSEGKYAGTGKNSKIGATNKQSELSRAPRRADHGGEPVDFDKFKPANPDYNWEDKADEGQELGNEYSNVGIRNKRQKGEADGKWPKSTDSKSPLGGRGSPRGE